MDEIVTVGDRKFRIISKIKVPEKTDHEKLNAGLQGTLYLRKQNEPHNIYLVDEIINATFVDIVEPPVEPIQEQPIPTENTAESA